MSIEAARLGQGTAQDRLDFAISRQPFYQQRHSEPWLAILAKTCRTDQLHQV